MTDWGSLLSPPSVRAEGAVQNDAVDLQPFELVFQIFKKIIFSIVRQLEPRIPMTFWCKYSITVHPSVSKLQHGEIFFILR